MARLRNVYGAGIDGEESNVEMRVNTAVGLCIWGRKRLYLYVYSGWWLGDYLACFLAESRLVYHGVALVVPLVLVSALGSCILFCFDLVWCLYLRLELRFSENE